MNRGDETDVLPRISVIIPVFNSMPEVLDCVSALRGQAGDTGWVEIIAVDNGSTDGSYEWLRELPGTNVHVLQDAAASVGGLRNLGAALARGEYLSFLDSDCVILPQYFKNVISVLSSGEVDATGSKVLIPRECTWVERVWYDLHSSRRHGPVPYINSGNLVIRRSAFEVVGGFRTDLVSGEDAELGQRLTEGGFSVVANEGIGAIHLGESKTVLQFFRRQTWHGVGMLATAKWGTLDKPLAMLGLHMLLILAGLVLLMLGPAPWWGRVFVASGLVLAVPSLTVAYRYLHGGGGRRPLRETFLYSLYYFARMKALGIAAGRWCAERTKSGGDRTRVVHLTKSFRSHRK